MSNLSLKIQGVRGGNPQWKEKIGCVSTFLDGNLNIITVDNFIGFSETYRKRDNTEIRIQQDGKMCFMGTFEELIKLLTNQQQNK